MSWTSADSSLLLPGCTLDLCLKIPDPSLRWVLWGKMLSFVCVLYAHTTALSVFQLSPFMLAQRKIPWPSLPCVPWHMDCPRTSACMGSSAACSAFAPGCRTLSVLLVVWHAAAPSSYRSSSVTAWFSHALQTGLKRPQAGSDNTSPPRRAQ